MFRWIILVFVSLFIVAQVMRLQPSRRDRQLQALRQAAARAGLAVRFWTLRNSGYSHRQLPESGFMYYFPWPLQEPPLAVWAVWMNPAGEVFDVSGKSPDLARQWLDSFREKYSGAWALLECSATGMGLLWQERGEPEDVHNIAEALDLLRKNIDAIPG